MKFIKNLSVRRKLYLFSEPYFSPTNKEMIGRATSSTIKLSRNWSASASLFIRDEL
jgi:hypothetical protein